VRKFGEGNQPLDPDGNPDTSFLAKVPADVAWTFQTLDNNGMVLNMAQTWHQVRPGEIRTNCGGCHAHSQQPTPFEKTAAARPDSKVWDLTANTPLFTTKAGDRSGQKWDKEGRTGLHFARAVKDVEFYRDVKPILERSCVACHTTKQDKPAGRLVLDDEHPIAKRGLVPWAENVQVPPGLPRNYARLVQYAWAFQARRSPLMWKVYGQRLDGFSNDDIPSPPLDYEDEKNVLEWCHHGKNKGWDVDFEGSVMPPPEAVAGTWKGPDGQPIKVEPLGDEDKLTLARWIDIGCAIDRTPAAKTPEPRGPGWLLDESRPTLTLTYPQPGPNRELTRLLVGMHDYGSGIDPSSFTVTADFEVDGVKPGDNLAAKFREKAEGIRELKLATPIKELEHGTLTVAVKDRQGNVSRIERSISVGGLAAKP
jgi:Hydrazine synthase alpha subunit middle domain